PAGNGLPYSQNKLSRQPCSVGRSTVNSKRSSQRLRTGSSTVTAVAIAFAALAAVALAYGALYQHEAVADQDDSHNGLSWAHFTELLGNRRWLLGLAIMGLGTAGNLVALALAPDGRAADRSSLAHRL